MKTIGMSQQIEALHRMNGRDWYALFMEMGTGKSWTLMADAERLYAAGTIDAMLVVAPNGAHTNWVLREIPKHLEVTHYAAAYISGGGKKNKDAVARVFTPRHNGDIPPLRILCINIDALRTGNGFETARSFLHCTKSMMVIDESDRIKNPSSLQTKQVMRLRPFAVTRRICSGLPMDKPMDMFSQMEFLESGLLGTTSYRAFVAEHAELYPPGHGLMQHIAKRVGNPHAPPPQVVMKNADGTPRYKNLTRLQQLIAPHAYRILKKDCLDLPEKIYEQVSFQMKPRQRVAYDKMENELRIEHEGQTTVIDRLAMWIKLQQITSGFVNLEGVPILITPDENPRMAVLLETLESLGDNKVIIWAHFREELRQIAAVLTERGKSVVEYHGGITKKNAREMAVDSFQEGNVQYFIGQPQSGGISLTLTAGEHVIYYSNTFRIITRKQSEDRSHRIGTRNNVVYIDIVAIDSIDQPIARALQLKESVVAAVMGDRRLPMTESFQDNYELVEEKVERLHA